MRKMILRVVILYSGLLMALFYGLRGEWLAGSIGLTAAAIAFWCRDKKVG